MKSHCFLLHLVKWKKKKSPTHTRIRQAKELYVCRFECVRMALNGWYMAFAIVNFFFCVFVKGIRIQRYNLKINVLFVTHSSSLSLELHAHFSSFESPFFRVCMRASEWDLQWCCVCALFSCFSTNSFCLVFVCLPIFSPDVIHFNEKNERKKNIYQAFKNNPLFGLLYFSFSVGVFLFSCFFSFNFSFIFFACFQFDLMFAFGWHYANEWHTNTNHQFEFQKFSSFMLDSQWIRNQYAMIV